MIFPIPVDAAIESFETVERRAIQDADDGTKMARKNDSATSYEESTTINYNRDGEDTLKRESAVELVKSKSSSLRRGNSEDFTVQTQSIRSLDAYKNSKSISSETYFGHDSQDSGNIRSQLETHQNATALGSDMFHRSEMEDNNIFGIKASLKNFFNTG